MKIALVTDEFHPINVFVLESIKKRGFYPVLFGSYVSHTDVPWVQATMEAAQAVVNGSCHEGIFFCWSGTGASMVANKTKGIRAALASDSETAHLARIWNHANVLVLSNRSLTSEAADKILDAWFGPYDPEEGREGVNALNDLEKSNDSKKNFDFKNDSKSEENYGDKNSRAPLKNKNTNTFDFEISTKEDQNFLDNRLGDFNLDQVPATQKDHLIPLSYCFKDQGAIVAGINAEMYFWNIVYISILFVDNAHRHKNLGSSLLEKVETEAKARGAKLVHLDTFDFQAKDFYLKHDYEVFGILDDCPKGHKRYYLKKFF